MAYVHNQFFNNSLQKRALVVSFYATLQSFIFNFNVHVVFRWSVPKDQTDEKYGVSRVFSSSSVNGLARLLSCTDRWLKAKDDHRDAPMAVAQPSPDERHCVLGHTVYKWYDNSFKKLASPHRDPQYFCIRALNLNPIIHKLCERMCMLEYQHCDGQHYFSKVLHAVSLIEKLQALHERNIVHGDIRLSNLVCGAKEAWWIDLDLSGEAQKAMYPDTWNSFVEDGERHENACAGNKLEKEHDFYSLAYLLGLFKCAEGSTKWDESVNMVALGDLEKAKTTLQSMSDAILELKEKKDLPLSATGSPPKGK